MGHEKKRLLIYAHYYTPDVASTGQILKELAEGMLDIFDITVICVVPSYGGVIEDKYKKKRYYWETINNVRILRIRVPEFNKTNKMSRARNVLSYFFGALVATFKVQRVDYIFSISQPPILGGLLGVSGKWINFESKFIYNIQDVNPLQIAAVGYSNNRLLLKIMLLFDKFSCKQSDLIITVGRDLVKTLQDRFMKNDKNIQIALINNWIDEKKVYPLPENHEKVLSFKKKHDLERKFVIMYSGNIGLYYDLENLLKVIETFKLDIRTATSRQYPNGREVVFAFVGAGSILNKLISYKEQHHMDNVIFIPYQDKKNLVYSLNAGDVHWCVNAKGIKGVSCPSKYYGLAAVGKAVIGVLEKGSEIRCLIEDTQGGLCCEPSDYKSVQKNIAWFIEHADSYEIKNMGQRGHDYLVEHLTKEKSIRKYKEKILKC